MGAQWLIYDETTNELKRLGWLGELNTEDTRKVMEGCLRYCLKNNVLYLPQDQDIIKTKKNKQTNSTKGVLRKIKINR